MIFSLLIHSPPSSASSLSAQRFAHTVVQQQHSLYRVFFYHDGAYQGTSLAQPAVDEADIYTNWRQLQESHGVDLVVCIAAGLKRGILSTAESERHGLPTHNLATGMALSGLGQLVDAITHSDRLITFGG